MFKSICIVISVAFLGTVSCQTAKQNKSSNTSTKKNQGETTNPTISNESEKDNYRFIASFISKGAGKDSKLLQAYISFISDYEKSNNLSLSKDVIAWGREGEKDFCFKLSELSSEKQIEFINQSKALFNNSDLVLISENSKSINKK